MQRSRPQSEALLDFTIVELIGLVLAVLGFANKTGLMTLLPLTTVTIAPFTFDAPSLLLIIGAAMSVLGGFAIARLRR